MEARTLVAADYATDTLLSHMDGVIDQIELDTQDIQSRIPAALESGRMASDVKAIDGNTGGLANITDMFTQNYVPTLHQVLLVQTTTTAGALGVTAKSDVNTEVAAALGTYDPPTNAEMEARTLVAADYATATVLAHVDSTADTIDITADAVRAKTDQLTFTIANQVDSNALSGGGSGLDAAGVRAAVGLASANLDTQLGDIPTVSEFNARTQTTANYATSTALGTTDSRVQTLTTRVGVPVVSVSDDLAAVKTDTGNLITRIPSALFAGITSLAQWLGLIAGKQTGNTTARNELRATGAGSGTFDEATDSVEALRDRGDAAWTTGSGLDAAGVRAAVGLASANLDTQLGDIPNNSEFEARTLPSASYAEPGDAMTLADGSITSAKFSVAPITGVATGFLEKQEQLHRSRYEKSTTTGTTTSGERKEYADDGTTVIVTQAWSDNGSTSTQSKAT
jgi:hypothetical protein